MSDAVSADFDAGDKARFQRARLEKQSLLFVDQSVGELHCQSVVCTGYVTLDSVCTYLINIYVKIGKFVLFVFLKQYVSCHSKIKIKKSYVWIVKEKQRLIHS